MRHPGLKEGEIRNICDDMYQYVVRADGYGGMRILKKRKIE